MGHLIIHYNQYGNLSNMYQCNEFLHNHFTNRKIYKNLNSTFYHNLKEMNVSEIVDFTNLPNSIIIHDNF
jgi:hypothetical protein